MFITFEGIEGVGKTTHINFVAEILRQRDIPFILTREPGGTEIGEELRSILLKHRDGHVSAMTELLLMFAARAQHIHEIIKPALTQHKWVLCDRFLDATYAYQGGGRKILQSHIDSLAQLVLGDFHPDLTFIFDADPELGLKRAQHRSHHLDRFERETIDFFERVRQAYLIRAKTDPKRYQVIDASRSISEIQQELLEILERETHGSIRV